jgi:hypothetical protein
MKKGSKIFGLIVKLFASNDAKNAIRSNFISGFDTNKDGKLSLEDWSNGKWKDIAWWKIAFGIALLVGGFYFGVETLETWIDFLTNGNK